LPATLQPDFDRILRAFEHSAAGHDEEAIQELQLIGLRSPFLEWKVLLRGLQAFYRRDDARALDNWQRLDTERLPWRLVAPLRCTIDPDFRKAQPSESQLLLQRQIDRLQGNALVAGLRILQTQLTSNDNLNQAFRQLQTIVPALRQQAPHLLPRLASCVYWAIVREGTSKDIPRFQHLFGKPSDDPTCHRLAALACDFHDDVDTAHKNWQAFEKSIADNSAAWPGDEGIRARAMIWTHLAENAQQWQAEIDIDDLNPLGKSPGKLKPPKPSAAECYQRSLSLVPDDIDVHMALINHYQHLHEPKQAETAARALVDRFPDHGPGLSTLAALLSDRKEHVEALALLQRALKHNPIDRDLRERVGAEHTRVGFLHAEASRFDEARAQFALAMPYVDPLAAARIDCKWAICELKTNNSDRAEELIRQAQDRCGSPLVTALNLSISAIRLGLKPALRKRFDADFKTALAQPPTTQAVTGSLLTLAVVFAQDVDYRGRKTHSTKVLDYALRALSLTFTEVELEQVGDHLTIMQASKHLQKFAHKGCTEFAANPVFWLLEAECHLLSKKQVRRHLVSRLLANAQRRIMSLPTGERRDMLMARWSALEIKLRRSDPFAAMYQRLSRVFADVLDHGTAEFGDDLDVDN
jgi:tetratricopeptide (TPR) repeat protein